MKIIQYWKIFKFTKHKQPDFSVAKLEHNKVIIEDIDVFNYKLEGETYRLLRKFKTPQYKTVYAMRNKKAFNTFYFIQNYDVVITDKNGLVIEVFDNLKSGFISKKYENGYSIYFMVVGSIKYYNIKPKNVLKIIRLSEWY